MSDDREPPTDKVSLAAWVWVRLDWSKFFLTLATALCVPAFMYLLDHRDEQIPRLFQSTFALICLVVALITGGIVAFGRYVLGKVDKANEEAKQFILGRLRDTDHRERNCQQMLGAQRKEIERNQKQIAALRGRLAWVTRILKANGLSAQLEPPEPEEA